MDTALPDDINPDKQRLSLAALRAQLLKNLINIPSNVPEHKAVVYREINKFLESKVDKFLLLVNYDTLENFNPNKIEWYYEIYKEGLEVSASLGPIMDNDLEIKVKEIIDFLSPKSITEFCEMGSTRLSEYFVVLSSWCRDKLIEHRRKTIYNSLDPLMWIKNAEDQDQGAMMFTIQHLDKDMPFILDKIQLLKSRKI